VRSLVELSLAGEHRRGHGSLYAALSRGRIDIEAVKTAVAAVAVPRAADGRIVLAVDVTCWLRPEAHTSPQRVLCHTYGRGKDTHMMIPGWPYSLVTASETARRPRRWISAGSPRATTLPPSQPASCARWCSG
jgi:hypothetical protein